jgi:signal transduction histidine kinase
MPGGSITAEFRLRSKDGTWLWMEGTGTNCLADPGIRGVVVNYHDITQSKQQALELAEANRRKDEFLAMLAHELRNPLAPIRNALHILKQSHAGGPVEPLRAMMERQVQHLARLVDDLLDVSRITRGKIELRKQVVSLAAVVSRAVEASRSLIEGRRLELEVALPAEPLRLEADPTRLEQVVANLLHNAGKYTEPGGHIRLTAALAPSSEGGEVVLRVQDSGIGIPAEMLPHIFDLFVQVDHRHARSQGGLGIGLTLVRRLVELHGGTVEAFSAGLGRGSEFVVRLPALSEKREREGRAGREDAGDAAPTPGRRILVVDDNVDAAESLALLLRLQGHDVAVAADGPTALEKARAERPEVIFLDLGMPGMDGYEVARRLRQLPDVGPVRLVALTGWGQEEDRRRTRQAGFDHHVVKPVEPDALHQLLSQPV